MIRLRKFPVKNQKPYQFFTCIFTYFMTSFHRCKIHKLCGEAVRHGLSLNRLTYFSNPCLGVIVNGNFA